MSSANGQMILVAGPYRSGTGDDPVKLYAELCETVDDVIKHFQQEGRPLPEPRVRPMRDVG